MIELVKPEFIAGSEKRFFDFMSKLGSEKICLVSHISDLDGVVSAKIANSIFNADLLKFVDYYNIDMNLVAELKRLKVKKIIMLDLMINFPEVIIEFEKFADVLIIDHHTFEKDYNSNRVVYMNSQGFCAAYLSYYLFSKMQDLEKFDWLVACACVSDWQYIKNKGWMEKVYEKYGEKFVGTIEGVKKGKFWDIILIFSSAIMYFRAKDGNPAKVYEKIREKFGDVKDLSMYDAVIRNEITDKIAEFEKRKVEIKDGWFYEFKSPYPIKSAVATDISSKIIDKTIIIAQDKGEVYEISCRRQDGKNDMNALLKELIKGLNDETGGHFKAAGGSVKKKDVDEFKKRLKNL